MTTRIALNADGSLDLRTDAFAPKLLRRGPRSVRIALVGARALLLGGDHITLDVSVAEGCTLELVESAATVAYDGRGAPSSWTTTLEVRGTLVWDSEPLVVADGADVTRTLTADLGPQGRCALRETIVLGRTGESGGPLLTRTRITQDGRPLLVEDLDLRDPHVRRSPAVLGDHRTLDTAVLAGSRFEHSDALQLAGCGTVLRSVGGSIAGDWPNLCDPIRAVTG